MKNNKVQNLIQEELKKRILVLDGAMGTMIQKCGLAEEDFRGERFAEHSINLKGCNDVLNLSQPELIKEIHYQYLEAGADIIETNTFNSTTVSLADYKLEKFTFELNKQGALIAREAINEYKKNIEEKSLDGKSFFIAGAVGPTNKTASMPTDVNKPGDRAISWAELKEAYSEQMDGLIAGGVDLILIETIFDTLNAKAALMAAQESFEKAGIVLPIMISGTIADASGRILSGQTLEAFVASLTHAPLLSIGLNCSYGADQLTPFVEELSKLTSLPISVYPNAGLPNELGQYIEHPMHTAAQIKKWAESGNVNIVGGCCGTTPDHIRQIALAVNGLAPRNSRTSKKTTVLTGLEKLEIVKENNFINIGERTNVAGSKKFARLIREKKYEEALSIAREQVENGAQIIDINLDDALLDAQQEMIIFLRYLGADPDISKVPIMVDSSRLEVVFAGLENIQGRAIVNSISLKEGEEKFLEVAQKIHKMGAAMIVMAFDEEGQAVTATRKTGICQRAYNILTSNGIPAEEIIFDCNVLTVATGMEEHNNYAVEFIKAVEWIKTNLPGAKTSGGISNLSFSFRGNELIREAMHSIFLYHAINAGLDMGIVNAGKLPIYDDIPIDLKKLIEDVILNRRKDASKRLIAYAETMTSSAEEIAIQQVWRTQPLEDRISHSLVKGIGDYIEEDMAQCRQEYPDGLSVIEGPLMNGMKRVGDLFGVGKMFLPQVVKSARVMKQAVGIIQPWIEENKGMISYSGKIVLATVKGDVHDIGKNIVSVVLSCNNYEIIDLGVMTPADVILNTAVEVKADIVGLSGLITPSLEEMVHVAKEMQKRGMTLPLLIGGATTSELHTALKIAPEYDGPVVHVRDASQAASVVASLLNENRETYTQRIKEKYQSLAEEYRQKQKKSIAITLLEARLKKFSPQFKNGIVPKQKGIFIRKDILVVDLLPLIDYTFFFKEWGFTGKFPLIFDDPIHGVEAKKLFNEAQAMLKEISDLNLLEPQAAFGIFQSRKLEDDVLIRSDNEHFRLCFLRVQQSGKDYYPCLSDFLDEEDYIGLFAVSVIEKRPDILQLWKEKGMEFELLLFKVLSNRLAEALAEYIHRYVRKEVWAYSKNERLSTEEILREKYQGIRPAPGYPACPDHSEKKVIFEALKVEQNTEIRLTSAWMMEPLPSVCGYYFANPESFYFNLGKIEKDQLEDYAFRKNISKTEMETILNSNLNY